MDALDAEEVLKRQFWPEIASAEQFRRRRIGQAAEAGSLDR